MKKRAPGRKVNHEKFYRENPSHRTKYWDKFFKENPEKEKQADEDKTELSSEKPL